MIYELFLKSHTDAPDYEVTCEADSREEAIKFFVKLLANRGWEREMIEPNVTEELNEYLDNDAKEAEATGN